MFGSIGMLEIALIAGVALMVLGPEKFPEFAKLSMRTVRDIRKYVSDAQREIATELNPLKKELNEFKKVDVEDYVENLIGDDTTAGDDDDDGSINLEPDASVIDDWYPEELNEIMPGGDETAETSEEPDDKPTEDSTENTIEGSVAYGAELVESSEEDASDSTEDESAREEIVDENDPERLDG